MAKALTKKEKDKPKIKKSTLKSPAVTRKTSTKKVAKKAVKKTVKKSVSSDKLLSKRIVKKNEEVLSLPSDMTIEAVNKSVKLRKQLDDYIHKSVYLVAYVTAICFILVGATTAFSEIFGNKHEQNFLKAELINTTEPINTLDNEVTKIISTSHVDIIDVIPSNITVDYRVNFVAKNVSSIQAYMVPIGGNSSIQLDVQKLLDDKHRVILRKDALSRYYILKISYQPLDSSLPKSIHSKQFFVGTKEQEHIFNNPDSLLQSKITTTEPALTNENVSINTTDENQLKTQIETSSLIQEQDSTVIVKESETVTKEPIETIKQASSTSIDFKIDNSGLSELTGTISLKVLAPLDSSNILLYARPINSLTPFFVTSARVINGSWVFVVDTTNLPNNEYEFFARTTYKNEVLRTVSIKRKISNISNVIREEIKISELDSVRQTTSNVEEESVDTTSIPDSLETINTGSKLVRNFTSISENDFRSELNIENEISRKTQQLMNDNLASFQDLFKRYSVALQSENKILIAAAEDNLIKKRESLILNTLSNNDLRDISTSLDEEMLVRIDSLKRRVETFEQLRRDRTSGESAVDSDGDGVSDFDEINLYGTDPFNPDSDNDGFSDGIEIMRGFNPNNAEPETVIVFESPKENKFLEQDEFLVIENVIPVIVENEDISLAAEVKAEIRGKALPNSFVTLYIFSTPTIVTVKTDADGSFVYTFDKELEDGNHEVYIAMTDNAGAIIAQSRPFSFVKQAEAFQPIGIENEAVVSTPINTAQNSYNLTIGLALLSLGIILLMLGIGLRTKSEADNNFIVSTDNDYTGESAKIVSVDNQDIGIKKS